MPVGSDFGTDRTRKSRRGLRWIVASFSKRVTTADPADTFESASDRTVLVDRFNKVGTAGWCVSAVLPQHGTNADLVHPHGENHQIAREAYRPPDRMEDWIHDHSPLCFSFAGRLTGEVFFQSNCQPTQRTLDRPVITSRTFLRPNHQVHSPRQFQPLFSKGFADKTFPTIANDRIADFAADRKSQPGHISLIPPRPNHQDIICREYIPVVDPIKLRLSPQSNGFRESLVGHDKARLISWVKLTRPIPLLKQTGSSVYSISSTHPDPPQRLRWATPPEASPTGRPNGPWP